MTGVRGEGDRGQPARPRVLQRQVAMQSGRLASEMQKRRDAAVEFEASVRERNRLAANLHDTLLQSLAGAGFQLDTCRRAVARQDLGDTSDHLDVARRMLKHQAESRGHDCVLPC